MADFYLDHNVPIAVAAELRRFEHAAVTARDLGTTAARDHEHLLIASQNQWTLISRDFKDFLELHLAWKSWSRAWGVDASHEGILVIPHHWRPSQVATEVNDMLAGRISLANTLYRWTPSRGWIEVS